LIARNIGRNCINIFCLISRTHLKNIKGYTEGISETFSPHLLGVSLAVPQEQMRKTYVAMIELSHSPKYWPLDAKWSCP
jgi:hypothetical protein